MRAAAALADMPPRAQMPPDSHVQPDEVVSALRANKVPLVEIAKHLEAARPAGSAPWHAWHVWQEALRREMGEEHDLRAEVERVLDLLARGGVTSVLFKSCGGIPYRSSNVDLLVSPGRMDEAARLLERDGHLRFPHYREDRKVLFRRFCHGRSVICVHLHSAVSWGRILILEGDGVIERSRPSPEGVYRLACLEDLLLITLAHALYETDQLRLADLRAVRLCAGEPAFDWEAVFARAKERCWETGFCAMLVLASAIEMSLYGASRVPPDILTRARAALDGSWWAGRYIHAAGARLIKRPPERLPFPIVKAYAKLHYLARLMNEAGRSPAGRFTDVGATVCNLAANRLRLRCRPAAVVSLSGIDGSGKSAAIRALREAMVLCEIPTRVVWSRGGFTFGMQAVKKAARTALPAGIPGPGQSAAKARLLSGRVAGTLFAAAVVVEQAMHYLIRVRLPRRAGFSILCDRSGIDTAVDLLAKLSPDRLVARRAAGLVLSSAPKADLAILLRLSAEEAARRKPDEVGLEMLRMQARLFEEVAAGRRMMIVEAGRPEADVIGEVVEKSLRAAFSVFGGARRIPR